uniref:Uncharacterized protein n=1 Tax=Anopheles maculatus TaxID=74869 RepID=A0A182T3T8_9DIPT
MYFICQSMSLLLTVGEFTADDSDDDDGEVPARIMFHTSAAYSDMTAAVVATGNTGSYHQSAAAAAAAAANAPVYVPSSRALPHSQYGAHSANFSTQNGWPADGFGTTHTQLPPQFYAQNVMMGSWRAYDPTGFQRTSPYVRSVGFVNCRNGCCLR